MSILLIGGMDRLKRHYQKIADDMGFRIKVFTKPTKDITRKVGKIDVVIIMTDKVAHSIKNEISNFARIKGIPCLLNHGCGVCSLRRCLEFIKNK